MQIITATKELKEICKKLSRADFITVDTEFMRDSTYWPKLCLIQIAGPDDEVIVDPLADKIDLAPFLQLLKNQKVKKVFHAARQDIEIFYHLDKVIPAPLFDTQVAAMVCGFGDAVSYENLIKRTLKVPVDKSSRFTDWARRPLTERQLAYAMSDVTHLRAAYEEIFEQLKKAEREAWVDEEMAILLNPSTYNLAPADAWKRLKARHNGRRAAAVLQKVAAWREAEAQERDLPRGRILKDDALYEVANQAPKNKSELDSLRAVPKGFANSKAAQSLLKAVKAALDIPKDDLPSVSKPKPTPSGLAPVVELLKVLLKMKCEEHRVAQKLVANVSDLELLAADDDAPISALKGWRREIFGDTALALKHGDISLGLNGRRVVTIKSKRSASKETPSKKAS